MVIKGKTENATPIHDLKTEPVNFAQSDSDLKGETQPDFRNAKGPIPGDKPGGATKIEDVAPSDGGTAAWLVVLGAWCCSFSSPGWINST
jgi:hypothetical protein